LLLLFWAFEVVIAGHLGPFTGVLSPIERQVTEKIETSTDVADDTNGPPTSKGRL